MRYLKIIISLLLAIFIFSGFWSGKSDRELKSDNFIKRQSRLKTNYETLQLLYKYDSQAKRMLLRSYGYATFTNIGVNVVLFSAEMGKGLAHNNRNGQNTYMNMGSAGLGFGIGAKDFRAIFLFRDKRTFDRFVKYGWEANAQADIALKYDNKGEALNGAITVDPGIRLYKLTQNGLMAQVGIQGTKYWKDKDLN